MDMTTHIDRLERVLQDGLRCRTPLLLYPAASVGSTQFRLPTPAHGGKAQQSWLQRFAVCIMVCRAYLQHPG
eukprot:COSAG06_NODE_46607_length_345_cov_1.451220_1_plen_71_part_10